MSEILIGEFDFDSNMEDDQDDMPELVSFDYLKQKIQESKIINSGSIKITVDGSGKTDNGFKYTPYFKVYTGKDFDNTNPKDRTRIAIKDIEYIDHPRVPGTWKLNNSEKKRLIKILKGAPVKELKSITNNCDSVWQQILAVANEEGHMKGTDQELPLDMKMPDYLKL